MLYVFILIYVVPMSSLLGTSTLRFQPNQNVALPLLSGALRRERLGYIIGVMDPKRFSMNNFRPKPNIHPTWECHSAPPPPYVYIMEEIGIFSQSKISAGADIWEYLLWSTMILEKEWRSMKTEVWR